MKPWDYYSTPVEYPWVEGIDIENFRSQHDNPGNYMVTQWIWWHDDQTKAELSRLEQEFANDVCEELGITIDDYYRLDPYDAVIGCPENHEYPSPTQFEEMFLHVIKNLPKKRNRT